MAQPAYLVDILHLLIVIATAILGLGIIVNFRRANFGLLKAKMFLGDTLQRMWIYSSLTGAFIVVYGFLSTAHALGYYAGILVEISKTLFLALYLVITYYWYALIRGSIESEK